MTYQSADIDIEKVFSGYVSWSKDLPEEEIQKMLEITGLDK